MIYTNKNINIISFILTVVLFFSLNIHKINFYEKMELSDVPKIVKENIKKIADKENEDKEVEDIELGDWYIEIPVINLKAPIEEGTSVEILKTKVGHFEDTQIEFGNIGLAAHNRGYQYNYFEKLKYVRIGDKIIYNFQNKKIEYEVEIIQIIKNTDWTYLENTEENKITLITCVENEPNYRRCVQAVQL